MTFVRTIGRGAMTGLVINAVIGSGIFGVPAELIRLLGAASPVAMTVAALTIGIIMVCVAEVASRFSDPGGAYLYVRTAFGRFAGLQVGWFYMLSAIGGGAASATLFADYFGGLVPWAASFSARAIVVTALIVVPAAVNYRGVKSGANLSSALVIAKLLPLALLIGFGLPRVFDTTLAVAAASSLRTPWRAWLNALLLLLFTYSGSEDALVPLGEVKEPRRTVPFALVAGLLVCAVVYTLLQTVVVATVRSATTDQPLAEAASVLLGRGGSFVAVAVMISTYGWISATLLTAPRLAWALAQGGDFPTFLGRLHARFHTPSRAILVCALLIWLLAITGTFLWVVTLTAGSVTVVYGGMCAALVPLRRARPAQNALLVPGGPILSWMGVFICLVMLTRLEWRETTLMSLTMLTATAYWLWARRRPECRL